MIAKCKGEKMNLFEYIYPRFYFDKTKPIRLFEAFSGVGCQAMALKRITDNYELVGFSEIDKPAIQSYEAIHGEVRNYGDITKMTEIPPCDIFTWSFPCTDLSKAGKQKGLDGTRSGLVYEVLRLLRDTAEFVPFHRHIPKHSKIISVGYTEYYQPIPNTSKLPKVLIMENVVDLVQVKFVNAFNEIQAELEQLGYTNYNEVLNAKDYGIPQNRERVFMVSILKDEENEHYSYDFPEPKKLELRLKDMLEDEVDEKYYLSEKALEGLQKTTFNCAKLESRTEDENGIMPTICARDYKDPKLVKVAQLDGFESSGRIYDENGLAPTINTMGGGQREPKIAIKTWNDETKAYKTKEDDMPRDRIYLEDSVGFTITTNESQMPSIIQKARGYNKGGIHKECPPITSNSFQENNFVAIPEATKKGYAEAHDGDGVYLNRPHQKRGVVQKDMIQTLKTSGDDIGVVVAAEIRTDEGIRTFDDNNMGALRTTGSCGDKAIIELSSRNNLRIRKLSPKECWRLMGISDDDFNKAKASGMSNSQLYKQAGNGIVVNVFEAILKELIK